MAVDVWGIIGDVEATAVPAVKYGDTPLYPDGHWYRFLAALVNRQSFVPYEVKKRYIDLVMMEDEFSVDSADESEVPESWEALRKFAHMDPRVEL